MAPGETGSATLKGFAPTVAGAYKTTTSLAAGGDLTDPDNSNDSQVVVIHVHSVSELPASGAWTLIALTACLLLVASWASHRFLRMRTR